MRPECREQQSEPRAQPAAPRAPLSAPAIGCRPRPAPAPPGAGSTTDSAACPPGSWSPGPSVHGGWRGAPHGGRRSWGLACVQPALAHRSQPLDRAAGPVPSSPVTPGRPSSGAGAPVGIWSAVEGKHLRPRSGELAPRDPSSFHASGKQFSEKGTSRGERIGEVSDSRARARGSLRTLVCVGLDSESESPRGQDPTQRPG